MPGGINNIKLAGLLLILAWNCDAASYSVYDHNSVTNWTNIPAWKLSIITTWRLNYAGESHSAWTQYGMPLLSNINASYSCQTNQTAIPLGNTGTGLRADRCVYGRQGTTNSWMDGCGEEDWYCGILDSPWVSNSVNVIKAGLLHANVFVTNAPRAVGFGWCWDMTWHNDPLSQIDPAYQTRWGGSSVGGPDGDLPWAIVAGSYIYTTNRISLSNYLWATQQYSDYCTAQAYDTTIFFTTGPADRGDTEKAFQRHLKNKAIREYVTNTGGILFDYADILSWSPVNGCYYTNSWTDYGTILQRFFSTHPYSETNLDGTYQTGSTYSQTHIGENGALSLAKAMWVMLADLVPDTNTTPRVVRSSVMRIGKLRGP